MTLHLNQPLTHNGEVFQYEEKDYPRYKTQIEIARERLRRYHELVGFGDSGTYEDINLNQPLTDSDIEFFFKEKAFPKKPKFPWPEVLILAAVAAYIWYHVIFKT